MKSHYLQLQVVAAVLVQRSGQCVPVQSAESFLQAFNNICTIFQDDR